MAPVGDAASSEPGGWSDSRPRCGRKNPHPWWCRIARPRPLPPWCRCLGALPLGAPGHLCRTTPRRSGGVGSPPPRAAPHHPRGRAAANVCYPYVSRSRMSPRPTKAFGDIRPLVSRASPVCLGSRSVSLAKRLVAVHCGIGCARPVCRAMHGAESLSCPTGRPRGGRGDIEGVAAYDAAALPVGQRNHGAVHSRGVARAS